jgi:hypothetical protein
MIFEVGITLLAARNIVVIVVYDTRMLVAAGNRPLLRPLAFVHGAVTKARTRSIRGAT